MRWACKIVLPLVLALTPVFAAIAGDATALYAKHCASCHGIDRLGQSGPALLPESLQRLRQPKAVKVISAGRIATQMSGFGDILKPDEIAALVKLIYTPLPEQPIWLAPQIEASRVLDRVALKLPDKLVFQADPLNLFVVVEAGDHHVSILDGDKFEVLHRFKSRFALHGGPKFSPDGRFVYFGSRDGWISKYDLHTFRMVAEIRAGINMRNIAISADGKYLAAANYLPHSIVLFDAYDLTLLKVIRAVDWRKKKSSRVSAIYQARPRNSFIAALKDVPEIWEISTDPNAPAIVAGLAHSNEEGHEESLSDNKGLFALRRIMVDEPLDDFFFDPEYRNLMGSSRDGTSGVVVNLNVGRPIRTVGLPGLPHLGSGITWQWQGRPVMATPHLRGGRVSVIDMQEWKVIKSIKTKGPGFFMRSHENSPYAWVDVFFGPHRDLIHIIDKRSLEIVKTLRPAPGKTAAHVEFTRNGSHALVSIWDMEGALVVYDAKTLQEVKRIPMVKPSGKYNVYNKITFSAGTSH
ncbi:MAG: c-type cytochrome [Alphaproteobacteria bacterium]|nr:c-type cytochrome [Alphaproteobacteria bacterium]MBL6951891.1 c-type cytochrome [Alphaproteobacteria bacterium]